MLTSNHAVEEFEMPPIRMVPKKQTAIIDVADWELDADFGVFPQGARAKEAVVAPDPAPEAVLTPGRRYLFKRSKRSYPDQFWGEVVAYRIGCLMGLEVPTAFAAWNSRTGIGAALIEWFYVDGMEAFLMAGDLLQKIHPAFDRDKGEMHNMKDNVFLMRALAQSKTLPSNWQQWWVDALLFDAMIGNTDRHQDNWGLVFNFKAQIFHLAPLFDNGTSLGHERFPDRVAHWSDQDLERYLGKGTHHVKWSLNDPPAIQGHFALLARALAEWPETRDQAARRVVGEIVKEASGQFVFRYFKGSTDFLSAQAAGFQGFPAFSLNQAETRQGVIESLMRRLPPRNREDFADYLAQHRLPHPFQNSDFALLGYTGARLPSDGFALVPVFPGNAVPCDYLIEVAGLRHVIGSDVSTIQDGDPVTFEPDTDNPVDQDALTVLHHGKRIGYVNRALKETFHQWLSTHTIHAVVERQNGKPERPLVFVRVSVN